MWSKHIFLLKQKFIFSNFFWKLFRLSDSVEKRGRAGLATNDSRIRCMLFVCWINKTIDTNSEYVTLIDFTGEKWLHECTLILRLYVLRPSCKFVLCWLDICDKIRENKCRVCLVTLLHFPIKFHENPSVCLKKGKGGALWCYKPISVFVKKKEQWVSQLFFKKYSRFIWRLIFI